MLRKSRLVSLAVGAVAVLSLLSGCSVVNTLAGVIRGAAKPVEGQCWTGASSSVTYAGPWADRPAIRCALPHVAYTFAVVQLRSDLPKSMVAQTDSSDSSGSGDSGDSGYISQAIYEDEYTECSFARAQFLRPGSDHETRLVFTYHLPTRQDWAAGARWARCDVSVGKYGSYLAKPDFESLPADIESLLSDVSAGSYDYQLCIDTENTPSPDTDPLGNAHSSYTDCAAHPQWREGANAYFAQANGNAYPGADAVLAFEREACADPTAPANRVTIPYGPSLTMWNSGDRQVECWVSDGSSGS